MNRAREIILVSILLLLACPFVNAEDTGKNKNILILYSFAHGTPAYRILADGIRTKLSEFYGDAFNLHMEYLETEIYPKGSYSFERFNLYNRKYEAVDLDLLICIGVDIVDPVKKHASEKLLNLPAIVIDFDLADYGIVIDVNLNGRTTFIGMKLNVIKTINSATSLFPGRNTIFFIIGTSTADQLYGGATRAASGQIDQRFNYHILTNMSMDEVLSMAKNLPDTSIIIIPSFNKDSQGVFYYNPESIRMISQVSNVPVFAYSDMGFGDGNLGGYLLSFNKTGQIAGETAVKILQGTDPATIKINGPELYDYLYDWRQLKRWDLLGSSLIPDEGKILYEDISIYKKYRIYFSIALVFILLQTLLIARLISLNRRQKLITRQLIDMENKFRALVDEDRILRIGQLTASLSHELNQPLTAILSTAQAGIRFINSNKADPEMLKELFSNIAEDDKRTAAILSSIRGMMKLEKREKEKVDLNELINELVNIYQSEARSKEIKLQVDLLSPPICIFADKIQIQQVLLNFINNAAQSIENMHVNLKTIIISETLDKDEVTVSVKDHGEGIPDSIRDKIFKPFVTTKKDGSGIGLAIGLAIINDHQGRIRAENIPGGGAVFSFSLKICDDGKNNL